MGLYGELSDITLASGEVVKGFKVHIPYPEKTAVLRLPTVKEFLKYLQKAVDKVNKKLLTQQGQDELALFNEIRLDKDGESFDEYEAELIIGKLFINDVWVAGSEKNTDAYKVSLNSGFGETVHYFRMPSLKELSVYRKSLAPKVVDWFDNPTVALYDTLIKRTEGYAADYTAADVPPYHKLLTVREVIAFYDSFDPLISPN